LREELADGEDWPPFRELNEWASEAGIELPMKEEKYVAST
jgi:hypothetical protein